MRAGFRRTFAMAAVAWSLIVNGAASFAVAESSQTPLTFADPTNAVQTSKTIQDAIDAASQAGGGKVVIPAGEYQVVPIELRSNVELHLDKGAALRFSRNFNDYRMTMIEASGREPSLQSPISGEGLTNVAITGEGTIDGQGDAWRMVKKGKLGDEAWKKLTSSGGVTNAAGNEWYPNEIVRDGRGEFEKLLNANPPAPLEAFAKYRPLLRPRLLRLVNCKNVRLEGITVRNSANWNVHLLMCEDITVKGITVFTEASAQNGDGIDFDSSRNITMTGCTVDAGDDSICLKSGKDEEGRKRGRPTENVKISNCTIGTGHGGIVIGSEMSGGVRNVEVTDCTMNGTDNGLRFKSTRSRGGIVENIRVRNIKMSNITGVAVLFDLYYMTKPKPGDPSSFAVDESTPQFRNFDIGDVTCEGAKTALQIRGLPEMPLHNIKLQNVSIKADTAGFVTDVDGVSFNNVNVKAADGKPVKVQDPSKIQLTDCIGFESK